MLIVIPFAYNPRQCKLAYYEKKMRSVGFLGTEVTQGGNSTGAILNCGDGLILT